MYIESRIPTGVSCFVCRLFRREHLYDHLSRIYCSLYIAFAILCTCVLKLLSTVFSALSKRVLVKFRELFFFFFKLKIRAYFMFLFSTVDMPIFHFLPHPFRLPYLDPKLNTTWALADHSQLCMNDSVGLSKMLFWLL